MKIVDIKCEHMPAQIDKTYNIYCTESKNPHFSFCIEGNDADMTVRYYKLIVASDKELIDDGVGDMYDSGLIYSSSAVDIEYRGKALLPHTVYYFKIYAMVGAKALKSGVGVFCTGLFDKSKLRNNFITAPDGIYSAFRKDIFIDKEISSVYAYTTASGAYELLVNKEAVKCQNEAACRTDHSKTLYYNFSDLSGYFKTGANTIEVVDTDGSAFSAYFYLIYKDGSYDEIFTDDAWDCINGTESAKAVRFINKQIKETDITALIGSAVKEAGNIDTSDLELNKLISDKTRDYYNFSVNCPQAFCKSACYDMDCAEYFKYRLRILTDSQNPNGSFTYPDGNEINGDEIFIIPYTVYNMYGDKRILSDIMTYAEKYFSYLQSKAVNETMPDDVSGAAYYAYDAYLLSEIYAVLGDTSKSEYCAKRFENIKYAFREEFLQSGYRLKGDSLVGYVTALKFDLFDEEEKKSAVKHLLRKIEEEGENINTVPEHLLSVLCDNGYARAAYDILLSDKYKKHLPENCYGWMYEYILGIKPSKPGFSEFEYKPYPDKRIDRVTGIYNSASGRIISEWKRTDKGFDLRLTVPINTKAIVTPDNKLYMPGQRGYKKVTEKKVLGSGVYLFKMIE